MSHTLVDITPSETGHVATTTDGRLGQLVSLVVALAIVAGTLVGAGLFPSSATICLAGLALSVVAVFISIFASYRQVFSA